MLKKPALSPEDRVFLLLHGAPVRDVSKVLERGLFM
jgi:hypothetical protein